jgi:hypothetical protein
MLYEPSQQLSQIHQAPAASASDVRPRGSFFNTLRWIIALCLLGVAALLFLKSQNFSASYPAPGVGAVVEEPVFSIDPQKEAEKFLEQHRNVIAQTLQSDLDAIEAATADLNRYFDIKREQVAPFLEELFSLTSKGKMLYYYLADQSKLEHYIEETAFRYLGSPSELAEETRKILAALQTELAANHNRLMLALEADLVALPYRLKLNRVDAAAFADNFHLAFDHALRGMLPRTVGVQLGVEAIALAVNCWVAPVIAKAVVSFLATRGIISGGTMAAQGTAVAAGAAGSWITGGASIVVGLAIALVIDYAANEIARADAEEKILAAFENRRRMAVTSFQRDASNGIRHLQQQRQAALKKALVLEISKAAADHAANP